MERVYDRLAREALMQALRGASRTLVADRVVGADSIDLFCEPDPELLEEPLPFGLVRRFLVQGPCAFEFFHHAPSIPELLNSLAKGFDLRDPACWPPHAEEPWLWIICAHRPSGAWSKFSLEAARGFPRGVYATPPAYRMRLVLPNELPRTLDTLLLRLLGSGKPLQGALTELDELGASHPLGALMMPLITSLYREYRALAESREDVARFLKETGGFCESWRQKLGA
jgi:hypothetical protein